MLNPKLNNKSNFIKIDEFVRIKYLKDSKSGRIKKNQITTVSKNNANYLVKHGIAILI
tara:strand:- start:230 stop:403 length:174 start_codon:yes stop_codon:yes gene_type:complete